MSIDTQLQGDPATLTQAGQTLTDAAETVRAVAGKLSLARSNATAAWEGFRAQRFASDVSTVHGEATTVAGSIDALAGAVTQLGSDLSGIESTLDGIRHEAIGGGLPVWGYQVNPPVSEEAVVTDTSCVDPMALYLSLDQRASAARSQETTAHQSAADIIASVMSDGPLMEILRKLGFAPSSTTAFGLFTWGLSSALRGVNWTVRWRTMLTHGRYAPRGPGGQFRAIGQPWYREAWAATKSSNWVARPHQAATRQAWQTAGTAAKWVGRGATVLAVGTSFWNQWQTDSHDPSLSTSDKVGRASTVAATTAVGGWAGAKGGAMLGAAIGTAVGGPVGTVVGGIVGGVIGGIVGSGVGSWVGDQLKDGVGKATKAVTGAISDAAGAVGDAVSNVGKKLAFWK